MSEQSLNQPFSQIQVEDFASCISSGIPENLQLVDVREAQELAIAQLEGFQHLPLSEFAEWSGQIQARLNPDLETIVMCHHGVRSAQMCQWLVNQGFSNVKNLVGGIDAYALRVDPTVPRY